MPPAAPADTRLVLVGGGHTHLHVLAAFGTDPMPGVRVTLIAREAQAPYSGMLPGLVAGHYTFEQAHVDLARLCDRGGIRLLHDEAVGLDLAQGRVRCRDRPPVPYDVLSLNTGGVPYVGDATGVDEHAIPVRPVNRFLEKWNRLARSAPRRHQALRVAVVGGGAGGVELGLAARHRLVTLVRDGGGDPRGVRFDLFTDADTILPELPSGARRRLARALDERGVGVHESSPVVGVEPDAVRLADGRLHAADRTLWVTGVRGPGWIGDSGLDTTARGFVRVDAALRSLSHPSVFAAGDVARVEPHPRPNAGVFAVRQGPPLTRNLRRVLRDQEPRGFEPQRHHLVLVSTGDRYAVGCRGSISFEGHWVWWLKDWIDRRWMRRWSEPPDDRG